MSGLIDHAAILERADSFRQEVREFCEKELPPALKRKVEEGLELEKPDQVAYLQALGRRGWVAGHWPKRYGGLDWTPLERFVFEEESQLRGAPWLSPTGVNYVGPVIYTFGNEEQKQRFLPPILDASEWWAQGYSEPGAGSDLVAIKTRAVRSGDNYVVNGQKMWTSNAHISDWMFALVRTSDEDRPQAGISFLLINLSSPGITIRPIITIDGLHHTNEVFLDNVQVPVGNLVGAEGRGWEYGKFLLGSERLILADTGRSKRQLLRLKALLHSGSGWRRDHARDLHDRIDGLELRLHGLRSLCIEAALRGDPTPTEGSTIKILATELQQAITETGVDLLGGASAAYHPDDVKRSDARSPIGPANAAGMTGDYLFTRVKSIYGGSNEIQRNIISKAELGL
jgi:alkylation response protein AidB-like acyl-CoA dehydrogenase